MKTSEINMAAPVLYDHLTGEALRNATPEELAASIEAAEHDGGVGAIPVGDRVCYVLE